MIQREIRKAISGKSFFYNSDEDGKKVPCEPCESHAFDHYYKIWDDFHVLGILPHGKMCQELSCSYQAPSPFLLGSAIGH